MSLENKHRLNSIESDKKLENNSRRTFLKKATYAARIIVALGALTKPTESEAGFELPPKCAYIHKSIRSDDENK